MALLILAGCSSKGAYIFGDGATGAPIAHEGLVAFWSYDHFVSPYANVETWYVHTFDTQTKTGTAVGNANAEGLLYNGPAFRADGHLLVPINTELREFTETGIPWAVTALGAGNISTAPSIGEDGTVYVATDGATVHAVKEGVLVWTADTPGTPFNRLAIGEDGALFGFAAATTAEGVAVWTAFALESDGSLRWSVPMGLPYGSPALGKDGILLAVVNTTPTAAVPDPSAYQAVGYDPATGEELWATSLGLPGYSPVSFPNGTIAIALNSETDQDGEVVFLSEKGKEKHRSDRIGWVGQPVLADNGKLYLGCGEEFCELNGKGNVERRLSIASEDSFDTFGVDLPPVVVDGRVFATLDTGVTVAWDVGGHTQTEVKSWSRNGGNNEGSGRVEAP